MSHQRSTKCTDSIKNVNKIDIIGKRKYSLKIWKMFTDVFNCMPLAALIEDKIFCMHGGISPELNKIKKILKVSRPSDIPP